MHSSCFATSEKLFFINVFFSLIVDMAIFLPLHFYARCEALFISFKLRAKTHLSLLHICTTTTKIIIITIAYV